MKIYTFEGLTLITENHISQSEKTSTYLIYGLLTLWFFAIQFKSSSYQITSALILLAGIFFISKNSKPLYENKTLLLAFLLPIALFASTLYEWNSLPPEELISIAKFMLRGGLLIIAIYILCLHANISSKVFINVFIVVLFFSVLVQLTIWLYDGMPTGRINGFIKNRNQLAPFSVTLSLLCYGGILSMRFTTSKLWRIFLFFALILSLAVTYYTYSRIAYLSLLIGLAYLSFARFKIKGLFLLVIISILWGLFATKYDSTFLSKFNRSLNISTSDARTTKIWPHTFNKATEKSLIFGNGYGKAAEEKLKPSPFYRTVGQFPYHSVPLELLYISGLTGLIAFYSLMMAGIKKLHSHFKHAEASAFIGVLTGGLAEHSLYQSKPYISLIVVFLAVTLLSIKEDSLKAPHANHLV